VHLRACGEQLLTVYKTADEAGLAADGGGGVGLTLDNFEEMLHRSFPPCMRHLVLHQRAGRHLKFQGRLQLRPFLREAGLGLAGALTWWERELCRDPSISSADFRRKYGYHVQFAHGASGNGRGAFAYKCDKTIGFKAPASGQAHGCPFHHLPVDELARLLPFWGLPDEAAGAIVTLASTESPKLACAEFFAATHPGAPPDLLGIANHPMQFLRRSRKALEAFSTPTTVAPGAGAYSQAPAAVVASTAPAVCKKTEAPILPRVHKVQVAMLPSPVRSADESPRMPLPRQTISQSRQNTTCHGKYATQRIERFFQILCFDASSCSLC